MTIRIHPFNQRAGSRAVRIAIAVTGLLLLAAGWAHAGLCLIPPEHGNWWNWDQNTRGITRVQFEMECRDASSGQCNGNICSRTSGVHPHYFLRVFGACHPTDCDWGRVEGQADGDWFLFVYDQGFATKYVWVRTYDAWPGWLRVYRYTDYVDSDRRSDFSSDDWFHR